MDIMTETSKRIEELEEENKELKEKLDDCRKLLKIAADDLEKAYQSINNITDCHLEWKYADEVREVLKDK